MLIPTAFIADKSKKKKVTPVSKEEQAKAFDILKRQTEKEKASEQKFIQDQLIAQDEAIQRQRAGLNTPKPKSYTEITIPAPATSVAPTVKTTPEGLVKKTFNTKYGVVDYVADERESKIFKGTDVNAINNLTKDIVQYFEGLGRDQGRKPIVKNTREKYTFDEVNAGLNPNFVEEETRKGVKQFEDATLGKLDVLGVRARLNELADYAKQSDSTLGQVAGGFVEAVANPMTTFAMSTGNIIDPNATLEERGGAVANLALAAIPIGQFAGAATAGASAFKQGLSGGLRNAIKVGAREYAKDTLFGSLALREITLDSVVRQLRDAGEVEGNVLRFKNDLRREAKRSGVNPSDYLKNKFQEAEVAVEPSIPSPTQATLGQLVDETISNQPVGAELNLLRTAETGKPTYTAKAGARVVDETGNPVIDEALRTADEITSQAPTTGNSAVDEALKVEQKIAEQATPFITKEPWQITREEFLGEGIPAYKGLSKVNWKTNEPITFVDATQAGKQTAGFFSSDKAVAEQFVKTLGLPGSTQLTEARISLKRPFEIDAQGRPARDFMTDALNPANNNPELVQALNSPDYDGLIIRNTSDEGTIYVPKTAEQIRADITHRAFVEQALAEGKPVPANVLSDYPDLISEELPVSSAMQAEQPPVPPTQTATTAIPEAPQEQLTSAKNRMTQEVRDEYDMGKFDEPTRRAWEESLTNAKQELQSNSNAVDNVIAKVESKQAINETEQSVLVVALSRERQNARRLLEQTDNATTPEEIATLAEQTKIAEDRIDNYTNALNRAGSETARTLNARRAIIDSAEDLVSVRAKARQTYGKTLEAADEKAINEIGKGLEDINAQIDEATGKGTTPVETAKANTRVKGVKESAPKLQPKADAKRAKQFETVVNRVKEKLDGFVRPSTIETMGAPTEVDIWQPRLNDPASQTYFKQLASVQNDMGKVIQKLVTDEAIEDFDTLLTRLQADGFNITDTDLKLILSADYPNTKLYDFSDIEKEYVKMVRRQLAQEAKKSSVAERGRLIRKVQDLSQKVQAGVRKTTDKTVKTIFEENIDLQNRLDDLQAQYEGYNDKLDKASQQERAVIQRQIDKIKEQITNPVLVDRIKREVPQNVQDLVHERELLRGELNDKLRELADKKFKEDHPYLNALQMAAQVPTELLVSLDNSAALTHGAFMAIRNPLKWTKATSKSFAALISEGKAKDILATVRTRDSYDDMVRAGVAGIKQRDLQDANAYATTLQKVPYVGSLFKRSNQAMEVFGAVIRADYFDALAKPHRMEYLRGKITRNELMDRYKLIAEQVNTVTGKGIKELPKPVSVIAPFANFGISRVKTATMTPVFNAIAKGDKVIAKQFAKEYFKYAASTMGLLKVAQMNGLEVGIDPSNPEYFGKIKLPGIDKWWDISGGVLEPYRILINSKPVRNVTGAEESKFKTVADFAQSKLGSIPKTGMNVALGLTGETSYGRNYDVRTDEGRLNVLLDNLPINVKIGKEAVESDKSIGAKVAESSLQFIGGRLTKEKKQKVGRPDE